VFITIRFFALAILAHFFAIDSTFASGGEHHTLLSAFGPNVHITGLIIVASFLLVTMWLARVRLARGFKNPQSLLIPESKLSFFNFFDLIAEMLFQFTESVLGKKEAKRHYSFIGSIFVIIFASNLFGLIPGMMPPTDNINTTIAFGLFVFIYYNAMGFKEHGISYLKQFAGPLWWLAIIMIPIEIISHIVRPLVLGLRLRGNIYADHQVLSIFSDLAPIGVPVVFYGMGLFVCFMQAFVFTTLTMIYISMATSHDH